MMIPNLQYTKQAFIRWVSSSDWLEYSCRVDRIEMPSSSAAEYLQYNWNFFTNNGLNPGCECLSLEDVEKILLLL